MQLTIRKKGLVIVLVPLIFEIVFISVLFYFLDISEKRVARHIRITQRILLGQKIVSEVYETTNELYTYSFLPTLARAEAFRTKIDQIYSDIDKLGQLVQSDPAVYKKFKEGRKRFEAHARFLRELILDNINPTQAEVKQHAIAAHARHKLLLESVKDLSKMQEEGINMSASEFSSIQRSRENLQLLIILALFGNIVVAYFMSKTFVGGIQNRILRIVKNIELFALKEPLIEKLPPGDEIAKVDESFHKMAKKIENSETQKREFMAMISHDIKTPLTSITNVLGMLDTGMLGDLPKDAKELVSDSSNESKRLVALVNTLTDSALFDSYSYKIETKSVSIKEVVNKAIAGLNLQAQSKGCAILVVTKPINVLADEERVIQVLVNLISNAIKYSPKDSSITVRTKNEDRKVVVSIEDNASPINEQSKESIFGKYQRLPEHEAIEGQGLGLAICKAIIEAHNGEIGVNSGSKGNVFWFSLPEADNTTSTT